MIYNDEKTFEKDVIKLLTNCGWSPEILKYKNEEQLIQNWADILFKNNQHVDRLDKYPLTRTEMQQIINKINELRTPIELNKFINSKSITIVRDNPNDLAHLNQEISLNIYDKKQIAGGDSVYQIVEQPRFSCRDSIYPPRRGDFMLLINGMPVIHVELKKSNIDVSHAVNQIKKYAHENVFTGLFSLIQVFVAMEPDNALYFANPGPDGEFNDRFFFHWEDFNNDIIKDWKLFTQSLLSIPMAHQLIGYYSVPDDTDGVLKVMRSYQYHAVNKIIDKVTMTHWDRDNIYGGFVFHTTGSGKTMTSFKAAQLIANAKIADKVLFLMDRIELGTQSLADYRGYADATDYVQSTEDTGVLIGKLVSDKFENTLIVTSIQKMSNVTISKGARQSDIDKINKKRVVFIVDECHRSTFGDMLEDIKATFPSALFFGFSGTPILDENNKFMNTTTTVFGNELHRYSIAHGIRDHNVLGFDPYQVETFKESDVRKAVALAKAKAKDEEEALSDPNKRKTYLYYTDHTKVQMAGFKNASGEYISGIEDYLPDTQYLTDNHTNKVVEDILNNFVSISRGYRFHAIFATSHISEAISYYYKFRNSPNCKLNVTCLFDPSTDNTEGDIFKEDGIREILKDYNAKYGKSYTFSTYHLFKKDVALRLAHKAPYKHIEGNRKETLDLLIVVDQMLTGYDSKWLNALYLDKVLKYENVIQAFSRTNRLFDAEKPHGTIKWYRKPHTMTRNVKAAVKLYAGEHPYGVFVDKLRENLEHINDEFAEIKHVFESAGIKNFEKLPDEISARAKFAGLFKKLSKFIIAAKIQGFRWDVESYYNGEVTMLISETTYNALLQRYKELFSTPPGTPPAEVPFEIDGYLTEINTGAIDAAYMNSKFNIYIKKLYDKADSATIEEALNELYKTFATLSQEEQKYASVFLHDVQSGDVIVVEGKTLKDYITEYMLKAKDDQIKRFSETIGIDEDKLRKIMNGNVSSANLDEFNNFTDLMKTLDIDKAKAYFESKEGKTLSKRIAYEMADELIRRFILSGGFEI